MKSSFVTGICFLTTLIAGCSGSSPASPPPAAPSPSTPTASPAAGSANQCPTPVYFGPAPTVTLASALRAGDIRLELQSSSKACYIAHEQLVGRKLPNQTVGSTRAVAGAIVLDGSNSVKADQSKLVLTLTSFESDDGQRDGAVSRMFRTAPSAEFVVRQVSGLPSAFPNSGTVKFQLVGDMTIKGVTKPVTWDVDAQFDGGSVNGSATTAIKFSDFGMPTPKTALVLSVEDTLGLRIDFQTKMTLGS